MARTTPIRPKLDLPYPLPEGVRPKDYKPFKITPKRGWGGDTNLITREMSVPLGSESADEQVRLHELGHVRWSPANVSHVALQEETVQSCEDFRINLLLRKKGFKQDAPIIGPDELSRYEEELSKGKVTRLTAACISAASMGTADERFIKGLHKAAKYYVHEDAVRAAKWAQRYADPDNFDFSVRMGEYLEAMFAPDEPPGPDPGDIKLPPGVSSPEEATKDLLEQIDRYYPDWGDGDVPMDSIESGTMNIVRPPLSLTLPAKFRSPKVRHEEEGALPVAWHRYCTDGRIFRKVERKRGGGAVLIDCSGSMSISASEVLSIMKKMPAVIIGTYAGDYDHGDLRIVAEKGRRCEDRDVLPPHGGNVIDVPALAWLGEQTGPRFWISDGIVTGHSDQQTGNIVEECALLVKKHKILRVSKMQAMDEAIDAVMRAEGCY